MMKSPVTGFIVAVALLMIAGVFVYNLTAPRSGAAATENSTGAWLLPTTTGPLTGFDLKFADMRGSLNSIYTSGKAGEVVVVLSESEATDAAGRMIRQSGNQMPIQVQNISVNLLPQNRIETSVTAVSFAISYSMQVTCRVEVKDGGLDVQVDSVDVPLIMSQYKDTIGDTVRQKSQEMLYQLTGSGLGYEGKLDIKYTAVQIGEDSVTIKVFASPLPGTAVKGS